MPFRSTFGTTPTYWTIRQNTICPPNKNRSDLLIIRKQLDIHIHKHIASLFRIHNLFEIKGLRSTLSPDTYYKTNGHAGYYINTFPGTNAIDRREVTLSFPTFHYPKRLFNHLTKDCNKIIENPFPGVYYIKKEMYATQVLVIRELCPEDSLYLACLKQHFDDQHLIGSLADDYALNRNNTLYNRYMNQFINSHTKGDRPMICEAIFNLYGTSSEEIREDEKKKYLPRIQELTSEITTLSSENTTLSLKNNLLINEINQLKQLLKQNNISY